MRSAEEWAAMRAFKEASSNAVAARRVYDQKRATSWSWTSTLERTRNQWGLAEVIRIQALVEMAAVEDRVMLARRARQSA